MAPGPQPLVQSGSGKAPSSWEPEPVVLVWKALLATGQLRRRGTILTFPFAEQSFLPCQPPLLLLLLLRVAQSYQPTQSFV